jgi:hypothetical protein
MQVSEKSGVNKSAGEDGGERHSDRTDEASAFRGRARRSVRVEQLL